MEAEERTTAGGWPGSQPSTQERLTQSRQGKARPERETAPTALRAQAPTWSREALVMGTEKLGHAAFWASSRGRRLKTARAQGSAMARRGCR